MILPFVPSTLLTYKLLALPFLTYNSSTLSPSPFRELREVFLQCLFLTSQLSTLMLSRTICTFNITYSSIFIHYPLGKRLYHLYYSLINSKSLLCREPFVKFTLPYSPTHFPCHLENQIIIHISYLLINSRPLLFKKPIVPFH